ncbi:hypothetical protein NFHSH190041_01990 [Shewanella sp. NFH-SH190041]|uniref:DUF2489 domain-containing protein n=1 Tax=Shewanella sp. NFH-SH190041 TaxID=2950245 RepID=UPI0021C37448|nr:DUF2489 domain-containing protein [Shewanella sp. NFH-SH190041]BDM62747.1 hypothetical protein NFHSH190041_01990 [Shewanella sp. NFH-SH190041]
MYTAWLLLAVIIILILSVYASMLLWRLKQQRNQQQQAQQAQHQAAEQKRERLLDDIRYIAKAMLEQRCELSEGVVRIVHLADMLSLSEQISADYPNLFAHFDVIRHHPIRDARQALPKQQRMQLDLTRMKSEAALEQGILAEMQLMQEFSPPQRH